jgi:hypothetical protein
VSNWVVAEGPFTELRTRRVVHPSSCSFTPDFDRALLAAHAVKKFSAIGGYEQAKKNAFMAFSEREIINQALNRTLRFTGSTHLKRARQYVREYLGKLDELVLGDIVSLSYFGPGVCRGSKNDELSKARSLTITRELAPFGPALLEQTGLSRMLYGFDGPASLVSNQVFCIEDAKLQCVPKDETKARVITVEPALNSFLQNGIGEYLRRRLERRSARLGRPYGFNLYDQSINQSLAVYPNATLDLKDASNSLSIGLVEALVPKRWLYLFNLCRSHRYIDSTNELQPFHLFCGMGNGFCFPLQTILFASLVRAAVADPGDCFTVYGDDIIVSHESVSPVVALFNSVGLVINLGKSHYEATDFYRESCGVHTYHGRVVNPVRFNWSEGDDLRVAAVSFHNELLKYYARYTFVNRLSLSVCVALQGYFPLIGRDGYGSCRLAFWASISKRRRTRVLRPVIKELQHEDTSHGYYHALYRKLSPRSPFGDDFRWKFVTPDPKGPKATHERFTSRESFRGMVIVNARASLGLFPFILVDPS